MANSRAISQKVAKRHSKEIEKEEKFMPEKGGLDSKEQKRRNDSAGLRFQMK